MTGERRKGTRDVIEFRSKGAIREPNDYDETNSGTWKRSFARTLLSDTLVIDFELRRSTRSIEVIRRVTIFEIRAGERDRQRDVIPIRRRPSTRNSETEREPVNLA